MSINIGSMNAVFSNANVNYTAIGLTITEQGSPDGSNLISFRVNSVPKFVIDKFGETRILSTLNENSNTKILQIANDCKDLLIAIPSRVTVKSKTTRTEKVSYSKTYSEGHRLVYANSGVANIDVTLGSVFQVKSNTNTISQFIIYTPTNLSAVGNVTYSFSIIARDITITNSAWQSANVTWPTSNNVVLYPPSIGKDNVSVYTIFGMRGYGQFVNNRSWFAFDANKYLTVDTKKPPKEIILRYSVDSTIIRVDTIDISVDSV